MCIACPGLCSQLIGIMSPNFSSGLKRRDVYIQEGEEWYYTNKYHTRNFDDNNHTMKFDEIVLVVELMKLYNV